jgi:hypothetical protein
MVESHFVSFQIPSVLPLEILAFVTLNPKQFLRLSSISFRIGFVLTSSSLEGLQ